MKIISDAYSHAERLLREHRDKLDTLARALHDRETLTYEDVQALIGRPPHGQKSLIEMTDPAVMFPQPMEVDESELLGN
jgi:spastic paraplegia protein 7